ARGCLRARARGIRAEDRRVPDDPAEDRRHDLPHRGGAWRGVPARAHEGRRRRAREHGGVARQADGQRGGHAQCARCDPDPRGGRRHGRVRGGAPAARGEGARVRRGHERAAPQADRGARAGPAYAVNAKLLFWTVALANLALIVACGSRGVRAIRRGEVRAHRRMMLTATALVALFLASYVAKVAWLGKEDRSGWT